MLPSDPRKVFNTMKHINGNEEIFRLISSIKERESDYPLNLLDVRRIAFQKQAAFLLKDLDLYLDDVDLSGQPDCSSMEPAMSCSRPPEKVGAELLSVLKVSVFNKMREGL